MNYGNGRSEKCVEIENYSITIKTSDNILKYKNNVNLQNKAIKKFEWVKKLNLDVNLLLSGEWSHGKFSVSSKSIRRHKNCLPFKTGIGETDAGHAKYGYIMMFDSAFGIYKKHTKYTSVVYEFNFSCENVYKGKTYAPIYPSLKSFPHRTER